MYERVGCRTLLENILGFGAWVNSKGKAWADNFGVSSMQCCGYVNMRREGRGGEQYFIGWVSEVLTTSWLALLGGGNRGELYCGWHSRGVAMAAEISSCKSM